MKNIGNCANTYTSGPLLERDKRRGREASSLCDFPNRESAPEAGLVVDQARYQSQKSYGMFDRQRVLRQRRCLLKLERYGHASIVGEGSSSRYRLRPLEKRCRIP